MNPPDKKSPPIPRSLTGYKICKHLTCKPDFLYLRILGNVDLEPREWQCLVEKCSGCSGCVVIDRVIWGCHGQILCDLCASKIPNEGCVNCVEEEVRRSLPPPPPPPKQQQRYFALPGNIIL